MEANDEIEMLLWEYMDGTCSPEDMQRVAILIKQDAVWQQKYHELLALHASIAELLPMQQPSMRFTKNVMEVVAHTTIAPATRKYINKGVIRGIAAFFIIALTTVLGYALASADWSTSSASFALPRIDLDQFSIGPVVNSANINIFIAVNVALGLVLLDIFLRRKRNLSPTLSEGEGDVK